MILWQCFIFNPEFIIIRIIFSIFLLGRYLKDHFLQMCMQKFKGIEKFNIHHNSNTTYINMLGYTNLITYLILILILIFSLVQEQYSGTLTQRKKEGVSGQSLDPKQAESLPPKPKVRTIIFLSVFV